MLDGVYCDMWHDQLQSGEIGDDIVACTCCPNGIHVDEETEEEEEIEALVDREIAEAEAAAETNIDAGKITEATITGASEDGDKKEEEREEDEDEDLNPRSSRVLFNLKDGSTQELRIIEEGDDGYDQDHDCACPCHLQKEVIDDLYSENPSLTMFSRQISAQGTSLEDVADNKDEEEEEEIGVVVGPDVLSPEVEEESKVVTADKSIQVQIPLPKVPSEDYDEIFDIPTRSLRGPQGKGRQISRTISMSERPRPRFFERPLSIYDRQRLISSSGGGDGRDRSRTVSTGDELGSSGGTRLRRQLSRQQSCLHARCKAKEVRERQMSRDRDRDNANRLSVKDHEHFSVSIDDLNAATDQYFRDSEDNSALKTTIVTPTEEEETKKFPTVADVIKENNRHSLRNSVEVKIEIDDACC